MDDPFHGKKIDTYLGVHADHPFLTLKKGKFGKLRDPTLFIPAISGLVAYREVVELEQSH